MTTIFSYTDARQNLAALLDKAAAEGEVRFRRRDGSVFIVRPAPVTGSPLAVQGVDLGVTTDEIIEFIAEGRRYLSAE